MDSLTRARVAERLRRLLGGAENDAAETARRLGVDEVSLRMSVDELSPYPTLDVLAAVVRLYGIDPSFLLTGVYDLDTHRQVMDADPGVIADCLGKFVGRASQPMISTPTSAPRIVREA